VAGGKIVLREHDGWVPKHGHARAIRVSATLAAWFQTHRIWVEGRIGRPVGPDDPVCPFLSKRDTRRHGGFWDAENLGNELARLFDATGVSRHNHTAHRLRDSFASLAASSGKSVRAIQELLGHEALATTENYLRSLGSDHQDVVDAVGQRLAENVLGADEVRP
jgi:site-specific recombinase XerC